MTKLLNFKVVVLILLSLLMWDFTKFCERAHQISESPAPSVSTAASELAKNTSLPLFISGVNEDATPDEVAEAAGVDPDFFDCCVTLGYEARTTHGNGLEISNWATKHKYSKLIVVTSNYHIERALLEIKNALPNSNLTGYAVKSPKIDAGNWMRSPQSTKRLIIEWIKWRIIGVRSQLGLL